MTPIERARLIDAKEFVADCANARARAFARFHIREREDRERLARCLGFTTADTAERAATEAVVRRATPFARRPASDAAIRGMSLTYQGITLTPSAWAKRTGLEITTIRSRIKYGWPVERILTEPVGTKVGRPKRQGRGVGKNFGESSGTGGGSFAQEPIELEFSE